MGMIFPGMDPYLEDPHLWPGVHNRLIVYIADYLLPLIRPRYWAAIEERIYVEGPGREIIPDVSVRRRQRAKGNQAVAVADADEAEVVRVPELEIHESFLAILDRNTGQRIVTVIELVSPTNKYAGPGRDSYVSKQAEVRKSAAHLVEIDLLRAGPHVLAVPEWAARDRGPYAYLVCVNRAQGPRDEFGLYRRSLRERLPRIKVPLAGNDPDVVLDLQEMVSEVYESGGYRDELDYDSPCVPPLSPEDQAWANQLIQEARRQERPA